MILGQPCAEEPCKNGGICSNVKGQVSCSCLAGHYGKRCEQAGTGYDLNFYCLGSTFDVLELILKSIFSLTN